MMNFEFISNTKVIFGKGTDTCVGQELASRGYKRVLIHYGRTSVKNSGVLDRVHQSLNENDVTYIDLGGVVPNPRMELVKNGVALGKKESVDFVLAVGGGSAIDSAKAIAYGLANSFEISDLFLGKRQTNKIFPLGCILTIAAAGSETSNSCVITLENGMLKRAYNHDCARPIFAIMNPELTYTLPAYQTASGAADIMMHTMERYFTNTLDVELIDCMAEGLLATVLEATLQALNDPCDYNARATLMWAGSISHNGLLGTGRQGDFASHKIEHELSGMFDVAHGAGLCAIWGSWARHVFHININRFVQFAVKVFGIRQDFHDLEKTAMKGIAAWEAWCRAIGMPTNLRELGVAPAKEQLWEMANKATNNDTIKIGGFLPLSAADIVQILEGAK